MKPDGKATSRCLPTLIFIVLAVPATRANAASSTIRSGTLKFQSTVVLSANVPATATLSATGAANLYDPTTGSSNASITATVKRSGTKATVEFTLPYRWTVAGKSDVVTVSLSVSADGAGSPNTMVSEIIALPPNGATTEVVLPASL